MTAENSQQVFVVYRVNAFSTVTHVVKVFRSKERADAFADQERAKLEGKKQPVYDQYGLADGEDFVVLSVSFDNEV